MSRVLDVQARFKTEIEVQYATATKGLQKLLKETKNVIDSAFVEEILELFIDNKNLMTAFPGELDEMKTKVSKVPVDTVIDGKVKKREIKNQVLDKLGYKRLRDDFYPKYFAAVGIKACVYCNSQLTISAIQKGGLFTGRFDVDHYRSKDDYPWLSICLFNLYPACAPCNRRKGIKTVKFDLYSDDDALLSKSDFRFNLDPFSKAKYIITKNSNNIIINYSEPDCQPEFQKFEDTFRISGIYATQLDIVEELVAKSQMYNDTYREMLRKSFSELAISKAVYDRVILGNYVEEKDMHKRPMTKFMQDIAKDLKII